MRFGKCKYGDSTVVGEGLPIRRVIAIKLPALGALVGCLSEVLEVGDSVQLLVRDYPFGSHCH